MLKFTDGSTFGEGTEIPGASVSSQICLKKPALSQLNDQCEGVIAEFWLRCSRHFCPQFPSSGFSAFLSLDPACRSFRQVTAALPHQMYLLQGHVYNPKSDSLQALRWINALAIKYFRLEVLRRYKLKHQIKARVLRNSETGKQKKTYLKQCLLFKILWLINRPQVSSMLVS